MSRTVALISLVGSRNYNLAVGQETHKNIVFPASDKDYKVFVLPTFEDLYNNEIYSNQIVGEKEDFDIHDIRKLTNLLYKSNINFLEVLFSDKVILGEGLNKTQRNIINRIFDQKDDISRINLPYLFNACGGMHMNKMRLLKKGTEGTQHLVDAFGYDTKQALHAYRVLNFIERFADTDFKDFKGAMKYSDEERKFMLEIKHGYFDIDSFENFMEFYNDAKFKGLKEKYHSFKPNEELKKQLEEDIMSLVKLSI